MKKEILILTLSLGFQSCGLFVSNKQDGNALVEAITGMQTEHEDMLDAFSKMSAKSVDPNRPGDAEKNTIVQNEIAVSRTKFTGLVTKSLDLISKNVSLDYQALFAQLKQMYDDFRKAKAGK